MAQITNALTEALRLLDTAQSAREYRQKMEIKAGNSKYEDKNASDEELREAIIGQIKAMRDYERSIVRLAYLICQELWISP